MMHVYKITKTCNRNLEISRVPTKAKSREPAYLQALVYKRTSIGSESDPKANPC